MQDIANPEAWQQDAANVYAGRGNATFTSKGLGNVYKVKDFGRQLAIRNFELYQLPRIVADHEMVESLRNARTVACHCSSSEVCHVDSLLKEIFS